MADRTFEARCRQLIRGRAEGRFDGAHFGKVVGLCGGAVQADVVDLSRSQSASPQNVANQPGQRLGFFLELSHPRGLAGHPAGQPLDDRFRTSRGRVRFRFEHDNSGSLTNEKPRSVSVKRLHCGRGVFVAVCENSKLPKRREHGWTDRRVRTSGEDDIALSVANQISAAENARKARRAGRYRGECSALQVEKRGHDTGRSACRQTDPRSRREFLLRSSESRGEFLMALALVKRGTGRAGGHRSGIPESCPQACVSRQQDASVAKSFEP